MKAFYTFLMKGKIIESLWKQTGKSKLKQALKVVMKYPEYREKVTRGLGKAKKDIDSVLKELEET